MRQGVGTMRPTQCPGDSNSGMLHYPHARPEGAEGRSGSQKLEPCGESHKMGAVAFRRGARSACSDPAGRKLGEEAQSRVRTPLPASALLLVGSRWKLRSEGTHRSHLYKSPSGRRTDKESGG